MNLILGPDEPAKPRIVAAPLTPVDTKFRFTATCIEHGHVHTEGDALVFLAHDAALPRTLHAYRDECVRLGAARLQIQGIDALIERVRQWQAEHPQAVKVADIDVEHEDIAR